MQRTDDFTARRVHLADLTDAELEERFWQLAAVIVDPLIDLAQKNTTPSIERSVLLRMGLSSLEAKELVSMVTDKGLLSMGAGHVVYALMQAKQCTVREAATDLLQGQGWDSVLAYFGKAV